MRLATIEQLQKIDQLSQEQYGLSGEVLMESAGALAAREMDQAYFPEISRGLTSIVCGPGNNGGDGLVLARHLHSAGHRNLIVYVLGDESSRSDLFRLQLDRAELHGLRVVHAKQDMDKFGQIKSSEIIVDAMFGVGLNRPIEGDYLKVLELMNSTKAPVLSLDTPSGLDVNSGIANGPVIKADMTLTFGLAKPGFFVSDGPGYVGKLRVLPIGHCYESLRSVATSHFAFNEKLARRYLPNRKDTSNKSDHGRVVVFAGSEGMWGAGVLASSSAYRLGVGYVVWASFTEPVQHLKETPEILTATIDDKESWFAKRPTAIVLGPGLGTGNGVSNLIKDLKVNYDGPVLLDADALTVAVEDNLFPLPENWVLTPHSGELSRIIGIEAREIDRDRYAAVLKAAEITGCHVLLKGYRSVIGYKERCMVVNSGNSALAKAGTGDVLAGMIGGLLAQGLETLQATATGVYIHGRIADEWVRVGNDKRTLLASDIKDHLPVLMGRISGGALL